ncbi:hypothetical protein [uncultured Aquimarina sp.]|uniref:hypothetical protein n=1 Tax=uncultured Aquimarina sp. TaxID=575652 RepID=UPI00261FB2DF|nr:hypothetical protein [uncultured Aquimarina sp.]
MRNIILLFLVSLLIGCKSTEVAKPSNLDNTIVYVLPVEVENILKNHFSELENTNNVVLDLQRHNDYFVAFVSSSDVFWKIATNRKVVIDTKFYPLIFDLDFSFATTERSGDVLKRLKSNNKENSILRKQIAQLYRNIFKVKFTKEGEVLYKGFDDNW